MRAVRQGRSQRATARQFRLSPRTVQRWLARAGDQRLDRVAWQDRPSAPHHTRRTDALGQVSLLRHTFPVARLGVPWAHRLVRAEVDLDQHALRVFALRRRDPTDQPLLATIPYTLPHRPFKE